MTYDALTISRYIIDFSNKKNFNISNLKLQKLLYFVQSHFLVQKKRECFKEKIEAWDLGPVVPVVYREFKQFGAGNIPSVFVSYDIVNDKINSEDCLLIEEVVEAFSTFTATELVELTHKQKPWIDSYKRGKNNEISLVALERYFNEEQ